MTLDMYMMDNTLSTAWLPDVLTWQVPGRGGDPGAAGGKPAASVGHTC
jgi:hypothetical protein